MQLEEFFDYKNEFMECVCKNPKLVHLVTGSKEAPVPNFDIRYNQVFPYQRVPETTDDAQTFICFDVDIESVMNKTFYAPVIYVWAFTHKSKMRLDEGGVRTDKLAVEIDKMLNGSRYFGLGELELYSVGRFSPTIDYQGRELIYSAKDFNRAGQSKRPPANRKVG